MSAQQISKPYSNGSKLKGISSKYVAFITIGAIAFSVLCAQKGHSAQDILAYLTFVFIVMYSVHRR